MDNEQSATTLLYREKVAGRSQLPGKSGRLAIVEEPSMITIETNTILLEVAEAIQKVAECSSSDNYCCTTGKNFTSFDLTNNRHAYN